MLNISWNALFSCRVLFQKHTEKMSGKGKRAVFEKEGSELKVESFDIPEPGEGEVLLEVEACGLCRSDEFTQQGYEGLNYPRVPGHEVIGIVKKVGPRAKRFKEGDRVGVGWHGNHCFECCSCRKGDFVTCDMHFVTGIHSDGGYETHMLAPWQALARVPDKLSSAEAAPLMCAGVTVFNAIRNARVIAPAVVAVQGIGGLGHFAIQFAAKMGYKVVALSTSPEKKDKAMELGASHYIDTSKQDPAKELKELGGADLIVVTAFNPELMSKLVGGLTYSGTMMVVGLSNEPMQVPPTALIPTRRRIQGWPSGSPFDSEQTLKFAAENGIRSVIEEYPLDKAKEAYDRMMSSEAEFRVVLTPKK
eukprot:m.85736 g.85736  ORF g.85736 m.85736 type:complete len:362 (+) comp14438_c0_seq2:163-1248(+)